MCGSSLLDSQHLVIWSEPHLLCGWDKKSASCYNPLDNAFEAKRHCCPSNRCWSILVLNRYPTTCPSVCTCVRSQSAGFSEKENAATEHSAMPFAEQNRFKWCPFHILHSTSEMHCHYQRGEDCWFACYTIGFLGGDNFQVIREYNAGCVGQHSNGSLAMVRPRLQLLPKQTFFTFATCDRPPI